MNNKREGYMTTLNVNAKIDDLYEMVKQLDIPKDGLDVNNEAWEGLKLGVFEAKAKIDHDNESMYMRCLLRNLGVDITEELYGQVEKKVLQGYCVRHVRDL